MYMDGEWGGRGAWCTCMGGAWHAYLGEGRGMPIWERGMVCLNGKR